MTLNKMKLGDLIQLVDEKNKDLKFGPESVRGVNNQKKFINTKANISTRDLSKFQIVSPGVFVFNHRTSRNGSKFSISLNDTNQTYICTEDYVLFRIRDNCKTLVLEHWLYMFFNRDEFDRYVITNSWGSSTEFFNWQDICDVLIDIPPIEIQKKYIDLYLSIFNNQQIYEKWIEDLKLVCDGYIEDLRRNSSVVKIGKYIKEVNIKNTDKNAIIVGISNTQKLISSESRTANVDKTKYYVLNKNQFAYSPIHINDGSIALNDSNNCYIVSPIYKVFEVDEREIYPAYLMLWFQRKEFIRYCWFHAFGSARDSFEWEQLCDVEIPIPPLKTQKAIASVLEILNFRKNNIENIKLSLQNICPILIRGAVKEAKGGN